MNGTPSDWTCIAAADEASTGPAEHALQELGRLERAEPAGSHPPDEAHPLHVGDEVHGLGDRRELVRSDGQEQEDRLVGVAPDHVAEHPERVVVGPLDVVDEQGDRPDVRERRDGDAREVECPQELRRGRQALEAGLVAPGDGLDDPPDGRFRRCPRGHVLDRGGREQAAREEEGAADLLVGRDRDAGEPFRRRELDGLEQQAGLADARLALEGHRGETPGGLPDLLRDGLELGASADDPARRAAQLDGERALRPDDRIEGIAFHHPEWRGALEGLSHVRHVADYDPAPSRCMSVA